MPNSIPTSQNSPEALRLRAAASQAYSDARLIAAWQTRLAIGAALLPLLAGLPYAKAIAAAVTAVIVLVDLIFLEPAFRRRQKIGAKSAELYDTEVLQIPWNAVRVGPRPDQEDIERFQAGFARSGQSIEGLRDWYPPSVGDLPIEHARPICQRANMQWDASQRNIFCFILAVLLFAIVSAGIFVLVFATWSASLISILVVLPLLPAAVRIFRVLRAQRESIDASAEAKRHLERIWSDAMSGRSSAEDLLRDARLLQDELYDRRKGLESVPQWLYKWLRTDYEQQMNAVAERMVREATDRMTAQASQDATP